MRFGENSIEEKEEELYLGLFSFLKLHQKERDYSWFKNPQSIQVDQSSEKAKNVCGWGRGEGGGKTPFEDCMKKRENKQEEKLQDSVRKK